MSAGDGSPAESDRPATLDDYRWSRAFPTRWNDNDVLGHLNNTIYYQAMDTTVTSWLVGPGGYEMTDATIAPVVISSSCRYVESGAFPDGLVIGLRADKVGRTSIAWGLGIFRERDGALLAQGTFVHVIVNRTTMRPILVPDDLRSRVTTGLAVD